MENSNNELTSHDLEASKLYPEYKHTSVDKLFLTLAWLKTSQIGIILMFSISIKVLICMNKVCNQPTLTLIQEQEFYDIF